MKTTKRAISRKTTRREALKLSGLTLGGLALGGVKGAQGAGSSLLSVRGLKSVGNCYPTDDSTEKYSYFDSLEEFDPTTALESDEMRIMFMGSTIPMPRRAQQEMSVFVQVGDGAGGEDHFMFDCGCGVSANYCAAGIPFSKMDKIFINHLHGDHMSDLMHIYCFGPSADRKSPLYVWGSSASGVVNPASVSGYTPEGVYPTTPTTYDDGTRAYCQALRNAARWHTESFSFENTSYPGYAAIAPTKESWGLPEEPIAVDDDIAGDGYAIVPIELDWTKLGEGYRTDGSGLKDNVAYCNSSTGVTISHYPVIHTRRGSMGYKLEWNGLTMIYSSDTKPETNSITQAINAGKGVDVFIHEMVIPPDVWAFKNLGLTEPPKEGDEYYEVYQATVANNTTVQNSSHTPQGAYGYLLSQIDPAPRLAVATHFPTSDDTVECAIKSIQAHCPDIIDVGGRFIVSFDLMVLRVFPDKIIKCKAKVSDFGYSPVVTSLPSPLNPPKYHDSSNAGNPYAQVDRTYEILSTEDGGGDTFRKDGY